jgi:beta-glucuronidase
MRQLWMVVSVVVFCVGVGALALTLYLWFGAWPAETKQLVDHYRSVARNTARPPEPLLSHVRARDVTSLGGTWQVVIDPFDRGSLGGMAPRAETPEEPSDLGEFSFEDGMTLEVPGDWNHQDPRLVFYQGVVWYKREFRLALPPKHRAYLWFGAANYHASVYVNGNLVGEHEGGFTPFNYEVTDHLVKGTNLLVVKVDNRKGVDDVPTAITDWHNYGGLTRDVYAVRVPETYVRSYGLALSNDGDRIEGEVRVEGPDAARGVTVKIPELEVEQRFEVSEGRAEVSIEATPERWSPETPRRYRVEIQAGEDHIEEAIGFRTVEARGSEILLNGEPVFLRGISIHEEAPGEQGRARSPEHAATLLGWAQDLGCNFVRLAHYPHNEYMVREADRRGLMVWAEVPVYWNVAFESEAARTRTKRQLSELITRDRNRASVVLWSLGNETPISDARQAFMQEMADHVRGEDPTRLLTAALMTSGSSLARFFAGSYIPALLGWSPSTWTYAVGDPLEEIVDVASLNEYFGWYYSGGFAAVAPVSSHHARRVMIDNLDRIRIETDSDKPLVLSELGAGALAGRREPPRRLAAYSEEYQALVYQRQIDMMKRQPKLRGASPWILKDFRSPLRLYQGVQDYWNRKGLVDDQGERKLAFDVLRNFYLELAGGTPPVGAAADPS